MLPVDISDFKDLWGSSTTHVEHVSHMEADATFMQLLWVTRSTARHHSRALTLSDSMVTVVYLQRAVLSEVAES